MKRILYILILSVLLIPAGLYAQIEMVIVETYYISDANDATDTLGASGGLAVGSKTYRVYIDLAPGYKLTKIYGDANHALKISSTANFFNNIQDGKSFGKDIDKRRLSEGTVALDTWLTIGQATLTKSSKAYYGILKPQDIDGSILNANDGGSLPVDSGLLRNNDALAGIPIDSVDGLVFGTPDPTSNWVWNGPGAFGDESNDSTIFGSIVPDSQFISNNVFLQNSPGVMGVNKDSNQVLVAQLTTKGDISFELNLEVSDSTGNVLKYVANGDSIQPGEVLAPALKYPPVCGCKDPSYLEYDVKYSCENDNLCKTPIVLGCMDKTACNYDPNVNMNVQSLCCYPGYCNDRDIAAVCPALFFNRTKAHGEFSVYPNPVQNSLNIEIPESNNQENRYEIYDAFGRVVMEKNIGLVLSAVNEQMDVSKLANGIYMIRLFTGDNSNSKMFIKN